MVTLDYKCCLVIPWQMMIYACIAEYFTPQDGTAYLTFLVDDLDADTTSLQAFLGRHTLWPSLPPIITNPLHHSFTHSHLPCPSTHITDPLHPLSLPENTLLAGEDMAQSLRSISEKKLLDNYRLVSKIENTMNKFLVGYQHVR